MVGIGSDTVGVPGLGFKGRDLRAGQWTPVLEESWDSTLIILDWVE